MPRAVLVAVAAAAIGCLLSDCSSGGLDQLTSSPRDGSQTDAGDASQVPWPQTDGGDASQVPWPQTDASDAAGVDGGSDGAGSPTACDGGIRCGGACVDPDVDQQNCGGCGIACAAGYKCTSGVCGNTPVGLSVHFAPCAVLAGGQVWCWGKNTWGEVGIPASASNATCPFQSTKCQTSPVRVPGLDNAVEVVSNRDMTCARTADGAVYCWGSNDSGRLGHDPGLDPTCAAASSTGTSAPCTSTPTRVDLPTGVKAVQISVGNAAACVRTAARNVYCWGMNGDGEIQAPPGGWLWKPTKNANVNGDADDVAVGNALGGVSTICVVQTGTGHVRCWGQSYSGAIFPTAGVAGCKNGDQCDPAAHTVPMHFASTSSSLVADRVDVGAMGACALRQGTVTCWGNDEYGQSGLGSSSPGNGHFDPIALAGLPSVQEVSTRFLTTLVLDAKGSLWAAGWTDEGQAGRGDFGTTACPGSASQHCLTTVQAITSLKHVALVATGPNNSGAITTGGKVFMWGANYAGALGHALFTGGDVACPGDPGSYPCNPQPGAVQGLP